MTPTTYIDLLTPTYRRQYRPTVLSFDYPLVITHIKGLPLAATLGLHPLYPDLYVIEKIDKFDLRGFNLKRERHPTMDLRPDQIDCVNACLTRRKTLLNVPMGGGKTAISVALAVRLVNMTKTAVLVIVPARLVQDWVAEASRFYPGTRVNVIDKRNVIDEDGINLSSSVRLPKAPWTDKRWGGVIMDEVHSYTNANSASYKSLRRIVSDYKIGMSGTMTAEPSHARIRGLLGAIDEPYVKKVFRGLAAVTVTSSYKSSGFTVNKRTVHHEFSPREETAFKMLPKICGLDLARRGRGVLVLRFIQMLREYLTCPMLSFTKPYINWTALMSDDADASDTQEWLDDETAVYGSRLERVLAEFQEGRAKNPAYKIVAFTSSRVTCEILQDLCELNGVPVYNPKPGPTRDATIEDFKRCDGGMLITTYSMGAIGWNLQCADGVYLVDGWWNESCHEQAIARVARQGKVGVVDVVTFTSGTTIESEMGRIIFTKAKRAIQLQLTAPTTRVANIDYLRAFAFLYYADSVDKARGDTAL